MTDRRRIVLGITGNIASGKSTVVSFLKEHHGAHHIDSDLVYRDLVQPGMPLLDRLAEHFGEAIIAPDGSLDRKALGAIVFSDPEKLAELDHLTHPAVIAESNRRVAEITEGVVIIDAVKLIESGHAAVCDEVWLVTIPEELQVSRLMQRNSLSEVEARKRISAQPPLGPKIGQSDRIIENSGTLEQLRATVDAAWYKMISELNTSKRKGANTLVSNRETDTYNIEIYSDYTCPTSWTVNRWLEQVQAALGDRLQLTWRAFPLEQVNMQDPDVHVWDYPNDGKSSTMRAYQAVHAARKQGEEAFRKMHHGLFVRRHADGRNLAGQRVLEETATEAGLDMDRFREDLKSDEVFDIVRQEYTKGREELGVFGTPTLVFDNGNGAYLKFGWNEESDEDALEFFYNFVDIVRDRPNILEIKRPEGPRRDS